MPDAFQYDVFLSHSAKDKAVVRPLAERLRQDGLKVWLDEWVLKPGDSLPAKIEEGLEHSRVLACPAVASLRRRMYCMSANALGSDGRRLERSTVGRATPPFRDPANAGRSFIPLLLADRLSLARRVAFA